MKVTKEDYRMNDKELLLEAIDNYDVYSPLQAKILKTFINISIDDVVIANPRKLSEMINTTRATIYSSLSKLEKDGTIKILKEKGERVYKYKLNRVKLSEILEIHKKKLAIL